MTDNLREAVAYIHNANQSALARGILSMWTVYDRPRDHPDGHIARRFEISGPEPMPTEDMVSGDLGQIRECMERCGLFCLTRNEIDHPSVVETWT